MSSVAIPVRRCSMPDSKGGVCGQPMQGRNVAPVAPGAVRVTTYRCLVCDVCRCTCGHLVQSLTAQRCPSCGKTLMKAEK